MSDNKPRIQEIDPNSPLKGEPMFINSISLENKSFLLQNVIIHKNMNEINYCVRKIQNLSKNINENNSAKIMALMVINIEYLYKLVNITSDLSIDMIKQLNNK
jgi:hypothetical protein